MREPVQIRPYQPADQPRVRWLHDRTPPAGQVAVAPQPWPPDLDVIEQHYVRFWVAVEPAPEVRFVVADRADAERDAIVGMVGLERIDERSAGIPPPDFVPVSPLTLRLERMRVAPERQRQGIGRALVQTAVGWAREERYERLLLDTTALQEAAIALYELTGFVEQGRTMFGVHELVWLTLELDG